MADRSISINLRARVSGFIAGMREAKGETQNLSRQMTETGASADRMRQRLEAATRALPKIKIDADSTAAEIKFAELRSQMDSLGDKKIGIDISAADAMAQIRQIERELEKLERSEADINVRADIGTALAELRAIDSEISKVDGRRAEVKVDADVAGALRGIALVGAALASLPAATTIGVGVAGLGAAFAAAGAGAGAFAAVAIPGLTRVNEALKQTESAAGGAGGAMKGAAQRAAEAAAAALRLAEAQDRVKDAADRVKDAQRRVQDALRGVVDAKAAAARAADDAAYREVQAASRIADAERSVQDAHRATQRAIEDLTRAREAAQERIEDLALATERGALSEERAKISIERAKAELERVNASNASPLDKQDAALRLREAELALREIQERNGDLAKERERADRQGVEGSDEVVAAKERILEAQRAEADAERAVAEARAQANRDAVDGARSVADANQRVADAQRKVADAQQAVIKAQRDAERAAQRLKLEQLQQKAALEAAGKAAGGGGGAASKMAELSKAEKALAKDIKAFTKEYLEWQRALQPDVFPAIHQGLDLMRLGLEKAGPLARTAGASFLTLGKEAEKALRGPVWSEFLFNLNTAMPGALLGLGRSFINVTTGAASLIDAFLPFTSNVVNPIESASKAFADWAQNLKNNPQFHEFLLFVKQTAPQVWELVQNLAQALLKVGEAVVPLGVGAFSGLNLLAQIVAGMDPDHIRLIALAILAIKGAQAGLKVASFFTDFASKVGDIKSKVSSFGDSVDKVKTKASGLKGAMSGLTESFGGFSTLVGGAAVTGGLILLEQRFAAAADAADKYTGKVLAAAGTDLDAQIAAVNEEIKRQTDLQGPNIASWIYFTSEGKTAGDRLDALRSTLDELNYQKDLAAIKAKTAGGAMASMGGQAATAAGGVDQAKQKVDGFNSALDTFSGRTDALQALQSMKTAYHEAEKAIDAANGKLQINAWMTDKQRAAVIVAREKFVGYIDSVRLAADGAATLSGKTTDATRTILEQLPKLADLAGKNSEAREQILLLAQAYGVSRTDAEKAMGSAKGLRDVLAQLKSKEIAITAETKAAQLAIDGFIKLNSGRKIPLQVYAKQEKAAAAGAIMRYAQGGIARMAAGGTRPQPPHIVSKPTVLYGEGSSGHGATEAFIPYEARFRDRAIALLAKVANDFGLQLNNEQAARSLSDLSVTIDGSGMQVAGGLQAVMGSLQATMGQAGSLTSSIGKVGATAEQLDQSWVAGSAVIGDSINLLGTGVADMSSTVAKSVDGLTGSVYELTKTMGSLKEGAGSSQGGVSASAKKSMGSLKGGLVEGNQPVSAKPQNMVAGNQPLDGSFVYSGASALTSAPVNSSRVSAPQQVTPSRFATPSSGAAASMQSGSGGGGAGGASGPAVVIQEQNVYQDADADRFAAQAAMRVRGRGR